LLFEERFFFFLFFMTIFRGSKYSQQLDLYWFLKLRILNICDFLYISLIFESIEIRICGDREARNCGAGIEFFVCEFCELLGDSGAYGYFSGSRSVAE